MRTANKSRSVDCWMGMERIKGTFEGAWFLEIKAVDSDDRASLRKSIKGVHCASWRRRDGMR